jgi:hypothetical protein
MKNKILTTVFIIVIWLCFIRAFIMLFYSIKSHEEVDKYTYELISSESPIMVLKLVNETPYAVLIVTDRLQTARDVIIESDDDCSINLRHYRQTAFGYEFQIEP